MNSKIESVEEILSRAKPKNPEETNKNITHVRMYTLNELIKITILMCSVLIIVFIFIYFFVGSQQNISQTSTIQEIPGQITYENQQEFYKLVHRIADCEKTDYNNIHAEFRKKYDYVSYKYMPDSLFKKIYSAESHRACNLE